MANNLQAAGGGHPYDPRLSQTENYWKAVQADVQAKTAEHKQGQPGRAASEAKVTPYGVGPVQAPNHKKS